MKELLRFLGYCWASWDKSQRLILASFVLNITGAFLAEPLKFWISGLGLSILLWVIGSWWVRDLVLPKWTKYKNHRNELLTTIKGKQ